MTILDTNDHSPTFLPPSLELLVSESAAVGTAFALPAAFDPDSGAFDVQSYTLSCNCTQFELRLVGGDSWEDLDIGDTRLTTSNLGGGFRDPGRGQEGGQNKGERGQEMGVVGRVVNPGEPRLVVKEALDREVQGMFTVVVTAFDGGGSGSGAVNCTAMYIR
jgi:hypothetical protein